MSKQTRFFLYAFTLVFITIFYLSRGFFENKPLNSIQQNELIGEWISTEEGEEDIIINFHKKDSLSLIIPPSEERGFSYRVDKEDKFLKLFDGEELIFNWEISISDDKLILLEGEGKLIFDRKNDE